MTREINFNHSSKHDAQHITREATRANLRNLSEEDLMDYAMLVGCMELIVKHENIDGMRKEIVERIETLNKKAAGKDD